MRQNESPRWMNLTVGALGLVIVLSALATGTASVTLAERPAWLVLGFECVALVAGVGGTFAMRQASPSRVSPLPWQWPPSSAG